ncbi:3 beta-hydroxysteroid dehydrogenase/Delta 5--_4-isomerase type 4 [Halotydeus destructor]|nr:3 beta-hydroxysteroid dehydrogenase/Delta 5-->4-isomerase type 4 [Halotydeus destructor]
MDSVKQSILVTGSSGFLGQHVVKLLQEQDRSVKEIRCLDIKPYKNNLGHVNNYAIKVIVGDITKERTVLEALDGVDIVIHCAAHSDTTLYPDEATMERVNVEGTRNLINCAIECNVRYFIHVSTAAVVIGEDPVYYGSENTTPVPKNHILGDYARTKHEAEVIVRHANEKELRNGSAKLRTLILRPSVLYGEQDPYFITGVLQMTKENKGTLLRLNNIFTRCQLTYAGNAAWACLKAKERIQEDSSIGGEEFFITDDTPIVDPFDFLKPYVEDHGYKVTSYAAPYWLTILLLTIVVFFVKLVRPLVTIRLPESLNPAKVRFICKTYFFNRNKAILRLNYEPFYTAEEAEKMSQAYYKSLVLR